MKMLCVFEKGERLRLIGHLDLMRAMQRALRRSGLPVRYSQGFNPHILLSFAAPLPLGVPGLCEMMEIPLENAVEPPAFIKIFNAALPSDVRCLSARPVEDAHPAPMALLYAAKYVFFPKSGEDQLLSALKPFMAQNEIPAIRKTKTGEKKCDLKGMIYELNEAPGGFSACLALREAASCKPELLLNTLCGFAGVEKPGCAVVRARLYGAGLVPLETL